MYKILLFNKLGDIIDIDVLDGFGGQVKLLKKGWLKIYIEIVDVCMCYSCQVQLQPGEKMWIAKEDIFKEETILHRKWRYLKCSIKKKFQKDMWKDELPF